MSMTALPPVVQKRVDLIANRAIARAKKGATNCAPQLDDMFNQFSRRAAGASSDSVQLNHLGGKVGKR